MLLVPATTSPVPPYPLHTPTSYPNVAVMASDIRRDSDLWFEDGNVVIIANSTTGFRVYKGLLGRVSAVFEDTFKFKPDPKETIDDCPVVHVPDSPIEMGHFLRAVFRSSLLLSRQPALPFATIAATIRMAHKYQAQELVDAASSRLANFLVPGPGHWIDAVALPWKERWELGQAQCGLTLAAQDAIEAVNLARLIDKPPMLPVALYLCCLVDPVQLRTGVARADGAQEKLSDEDFARCVRALPGLAAAHHVTVLRSLDEHGSVAPPSCSDCRKRWGGMLSRYIKGVEEEPLSDLLVRIDQREAPPGAVWPRGIFCAVCRGSWLRVLGEECVKIRKDLSKYFALEELDGWDSE